MRKLLFIFFFVPIISFGQSFPEDPVDKKTTKYDKTVFDNKSYKVNTTPKIGEVGEIITIFNKESNSTFTVGEEEWAFYFYDLIDNYLIIDQTTAAAGGLIIYDLNSQKTIFEHSYMGNLVTLNNKIHFKYEVEIESESEKPECPQIIIDIGYGICYLEELVYDLYENKFIRTGQYECSYCE